MAEEIIGKKGGGIGKIIIMLIVIVAVVWGGYYFMFKGKDVAKVVDSSKYQAVFLTNGQVYFGKAEVGPDYVTLKDVFYIISQANQNTKEVKNTLIKRGKESHGPDLMYINKSHVVFIEPVSPESHVAKLINEAKNVGTTK